jgi:GntR family transcriptional regulator
MSDLTKLDKNSPFTLTYQLTNIIRSGILDNRFPEGSMIPTEDELIALFGVSRITVRKALEGLVMEGLLKRERGKGTFVRKRVMSYDIAQLVSHTELLERMGMRSEIKILELARIVPHALISLKLGLTKDDHVYVLKRLRMGDGEPLIMEANYLPEKLFPGLDTKYTGGSLYQFIADTYRIRVIKASERYVAVTLTAGQAKLLNGKPGDPAIQRASVTYYSQGEEQLLPHSYESSLYRGERYEIAVESSATQPRLIQFKSGPMLGDH